MEKIFAVDRIEGDKLVCVGDDGEVVTLNRREFPELCEQDVFSCEICDGQVRAFVPMPEERDRRIERNRRRLAKLFENKEDV